LTYLLSQEDPLLDVVAQVGPREQVHDEVAVLLVLEGEVEVGNVCMATHFLPRVELGLQSQQTNKEKKQDLLCVKNLFI
jgi:hypothetical protein